VNGNVFRAVLKMTVDGELRTEHGNRFHAAGHATTNARMPNFVLVHWTTRSPRADDRVQPSTLELVQILRDSRFPCFKTETKTLNCKTKI